MKELSEVEKLLKDWNGGVLNGAKIKLTKVLKLKPSNLSNWLYKRYPPSEKAIFKMAQLFGKTPEEVYKAFVGDSVKLPFKSEIINKKLDVIVGKLDLILKKMEDKENEKTSNQK